jgi:hypothetical protein
MSNNHIYSQHVVLVKDDNSQENTINYAIIPTELTNTSDFSKADLPASRDDKGRFLTGNSGGGRKPGSRNKFTENFMQTIAEDFAVNGSSALESLRLSNPEAYIRILVSLLPKDTIKKWEQSYNIDYANITQEEFTKFLSDLQREKIMQSAVESVSK